MGFRPLVKRLGLPQALRAAFIMNMFEREPRRGELVLDGMAVTRPARGSGTGSMLLRAVRDFARVEGYETVRLDVVDTNPRARALYERHGFIATETRLFPVLERALGFGSSTTMVLTLTDQP
jgi:ribosomal protein S18 acetylase RimI-like enzyme